ncbi:PilW family protein [Thermaerobacillus caldiproteolyticus]|uniref:PilW family protein n=1 Tax=Thermaerobacillus caldiproteolyticus TaxID=247480 RepID=UPI0018F267C0|nr:prepilin-type N-terminal cleavage/methylation domain-containing protein [Anoxybacillus caldiproteolyticus]
MKQFVNNEKGISLVELLAAITISSFILSSIYGVFLSGINAYKRIGIENQLRSEADYVVATIMNRLYQFSPDGIDMEGTTNERIQFIKNKQKVINPSVGLVEEKETATETLSIELQNDAVFINDEKLNSDHLKILSNQSKLSYSCVRQEGSVCQSGIVTFMLTVQDRDHETPSDFLYIKPFTLKTEFGF